MKKALPIVIVVAMLSCATSRGQYARLIMQSQPGDYIGQGKNYDITYTPADPRFSAQVRASLVSGEPARLLFVLEGSTPAAPFALLFFGTDQLGIPMQPGFYTNAQRADFADPGHPGLDIALESRGSNEVTGNFRVHEFSYSPLFGIQSFTASFEQHSEGQPPALFGTFTYQVPEPSVLSLTLVALVCARRLKRI